MNFEAVALLLCTGATDSNPLMKNYILKAGKDIRSEFSLINMFLSCLGI